MESADKLLGVGHERFSSGAYSSFSKAVAQFDNSFSQLKEDSGDEEEDVAKEPNTKKGRTLGSGTGKTSSGARGSGTCAGGRLHGHHQTGRADTADCLGCCRTGPARGHSTWRAQHAVRR